MIIFDVSLIAWCGLFISLSTFVICALTFALSRAKLQVLWGTFCAAVCVWSGSFFVIGQLADPRLALLWWKISHIGVIFIPILFLHFVLTYMGYRYERTLVALYAGGASLAVIASLTRYLIDGVRWTFGELFYDTPGPLYAPFMAAFCVLVAASLMMLYRAAEQQHGRERLRTHYLLMASGVGFIGGAISFAPVFGLDIYPLSILMVAIAPPVVGYAILNYHLFDIQTELSQLLKLMLCAGAIGQLLLSDSAKQAVLHTVVTIIGLIGAIYFIRRLKSKTSCKARGS